MRAPTTYNPQPYSNATMTTRNPFEPPRSVVADHARPTVDAVSVIPYVLACFVGLFSIFLMLGTIGRVFSIRFTAITGILAVIISVCAAAGLFGRKHRRQFFLVERRRFTFGCFLAFWLFDKGLGLFARFSSGTEVTGRQIASDVVATVFEFLLVWAIVRLVVPPLIRRNEVATANLPPHELPPSGR